MFIRHMAAVVAFCIVAYPCLGAGEEGPAVALRVETIEPHSGGALGRLFRWKKRTLFFAADEAGAVQSLEGRMRGEPGAGGAQEPAGDIARALEKETCRAGERPAVYCLYGWSGGGGDDMRKISVREAVLRGATIDIEMDYPEYAHSEPVAGITDMRFVGYKILLPAGMEPGVYSVRVYGTKRTVYVDASRRPPVETVTGTGGRVLEKVIELTIT